MATVFVDIGKSFSPQAFRDSFKDGIGRPSLFTFRIKRYPKIWFTRQSESGLTGLISSVLPDSVSSLASTAMNSLETAHNTVTGRGLADLQFRVGKFNLPSKQLETYTTKTYGPASEFPREIENGVFNMSVFCSGSYFEHEFFSTWIDSMLSYENKKNASTLDLISSALNKLINNGTSVRDYGYDVAYYDDVVSDAELVVYDENGNPSYVITFEDIYPKNVGGIEFDWNAKNEVSEFGVTMNYRTMKAERAATSAKIGGDTGTVLGAVESIGRTFI